MSPGTYQVVEEEKSLSIPEDYLQSRSIKLYGRLHSGEYILIQTPVAAIEELSLIHIWEFLKICSKPRNLMMPRLTDGCSRSPPL